MIRVKYEAYCNDYNRSYHDDQFNSLKDLADWIFRSMLRPTTDSWAMYFPEDRERFGSIKFQPERGGRNYWIHEIWNSRGQLIFSDGSTLSQRYMSETIRNWCIECEKRRHESFDLGEGE